MKEKPNTEKVEDAEELRKWRCLNQREMDLCWKNLAERMEEEVLDKYKVEEKLPDVEVLPLEWRRVRKKQEIHDKKVRRRLLGKNFLFV